jgi:hypothetical protein
MIPDQLCKQLAQLPLASKDLLAIQTDMPGSIILLEESFEFMSML